MGKIGKKMIYKKNGAQYNIGLYSSPNDVGDNYITLRVDSELAYAQLGSPGSEGSTAMLVKKDGITYAVRNKVEDPALIGKGSVGGTGTDAPIVTDLNGSYWGSGQNTSCSWYSQAKWSEFDDSKITAEFTVTINPSISLSDVDHYRLKYGVNDLVCATDAGTIAVSARTWKVYSAAVDSMFFKVQAEDASNNVLYSSPIYGPVISPYSTKAKAGITYQVDKADSAGNNRVRVYDGNTGTAQTPAAGYINDANTKRWFFVATTAAAPYSGTAATNTTGIACADTCSCNCNYCTCNCNYCTCNCNYCTCNCNYSPCGCSSN